MCRVRFRPGLLSSGFKRPGFEVQGSNRLTSTSSGFKMDFFQQKKSTSFFFSLWFMALRRAKSPKHWPSLASRLRTNPRVRLPTPHSQRQAPPLPLFPSPALGAPLTLAGRPATPRSPNRPATPLSAVPCPRRPKFIPARGRRRGAGQHQPNSFSTNQSADKLHYACSPTLPRIAEE